MTDIFFKPHGGLMCSKCGRSWSGQIEDYNFGNCFSAKHAVLRSKSRLVGLLSG